MDNILHLIFLFHWPDWSKWTYRRGDVDTYNEEWFQRHCNVCGYTQQEEFNPDDYQD